MKRGFNIKTKAFVQLQPTIDYHTEPFKTSITTIITNIDGGELKRTSQDTEQLVNVPTYVFILPDEDTYLVTDDQVNDISATVTGGGVFWAEGNELKYSGAAPSPVHVWNKGKWVVSVEAKEQMERDAFTEAKQSLTALVQKWLDDQAKARGYDDIVNAITYAEEPSVPEFQVDGQYFRALRSKVWKACNDLANEVTNGQTNMPTEDELLAKLNDMLAGSSE